MRYSNRNAKALAVLSAAAGFAASVQLASAQTWVAPTTGNWNNSGNWVLGTIPASNAATVLTFSATGAQAYTATNDLGPFTLAQVVSNNTSTGAITIAGAAGNQLQSDGTMLFSKSGSGALNVSAPLGSVSAPSGTTGGVVTIDGGNVNLSGGGTLRALTTTGNGSATISGGVWNFTSTQRRNDALTGQDSGPWGMTLGETNGSNYTFNITGGTVHGNQGFIASGFGSTGTWNISGASTVVEFGFQQDNAGIGRFGLLTGTSVLNVTGGAQFAGRLFEVGRHSLDAMGGSNVDTSTTVNVTGTNSRITAHQLVPRGQGSATMNINTGGLIDITEVGTNGAGLMVLGSGEQGSPIAEAVVAVHVMNIGTGGTVRVLQPQLGSELGSATVNITGGGQFLANTTISAVGEAIFMGDADVLGEPDDTDSGFGAINVDGAGSTLNHVTPTGTVIVMGGGGGATTGGDGLINVTNGGNVTTNDLTIGQDAGSNGTVNISGATSTINVAPNGSGTVGSIVMAGSNDGTQFATGVMNINGGTVSTGNTFIGGGFADALGDPQPGGFATITMAAGSRLNVSGQWTMASVPNGQGTVTNNGGTIVNGGSAFLSPTDTPDPTAFSVMTMNGGTFTVAGQLQVAGSGTTNGSAATVNISNNGFVSANGGTTSLIAVFADGTINIGSGTSKGTLVGGQLGTLVDGTIKFNAGTFNSVGTLDVAGDVIVSSAARNGAGTPSNKKFIEAGAVEVFIGTGTLSGQGGVIDLDDNDMLIHETTAGALQKVEGFVRTARNNGLWNQPGITSTAAKNALPKNKNLGVISGANFHAGNGGAGALFNGRTVATTDTLVKFTFNGDTDLNGAVNFDDYARTDGGFNNGRTGWFNGDFDYSGVVNFDDYSLIDQAFNTQGTVVLSTGSGEAAGPGWNRELVSTIENKTFLNGMTADANHTMLKDQAIGLGGGNLQAVPEPSTLGVVGVAMLGALSRRRRAR